MQNWKKLISLVVFVLLGLFVAGCDRGDYTPSVPQLDANWQGDGLTLTVLAVGDASAAIVQADGAAMLVDVGDRDDAEIVAAALDALNIGKLDAVVLSHGHSDHAGGYKALTGHKIGTGYISPQAYDTSTYDRALELLDKQAAEVVVPDIGETMSLGSAVVEFLGPMANEYEDLNDSSLVVKITYGENVFFLPGDMEGVAADELLAYYSDAELDCDVFLAAHHGSNADMTNSYRLLRALTPEHIVISSAGAESEYGFPHDEVLSRFDDVGAAVYRTDLQGDIIITSDGHTITVSAAALTDAENIGASDAEESVFIGNKKSKKFHTPECGGLPAEKNRVTFESREDALAQGYEACGTCNP